jgi:copper homeostasis protein
MPVLEVIAGSVADAEAAERGGAGRLEICRDLDLGGLTPPLELVQAILESVSISARVMLRDRPSYELSGMAELERLAVKAAAFSKLGIDGIVTGFLTGGSVDIPALNYLREAAPGVRVTFHHAFEETHDRRAGIHQLKRAPNVDRILTAGGSGRWRERMTRLIECDQIASPELTILAGGGMTKRRLRCLTRQTSIREFHVGRAARVNGRVQEHRVRELLHVLNMPRPY